MNLDPANLPYHESLKYATKTYLWAPEGMDTFNDWVSNLKNPQSRDKLDKNGWLTHPGFEYRYNRFGFRGDDFAGQPEGLAFGCSHTWGTGLPEQDVWVSQFSKISNATVWNLGVGGAAMDTVYRLVSFWVRHIRPEFVLLFTPPSYRYEITEDNETWIIKNVHICSDDFSKHYFLNHKNSAVNYEKNLDAISAICDSVNAQLYVLSSDRNDLPTDQAARDACHSGPMAMATLAEKFADLWKNKNTYKLWR
jgi:hypothetical protein